MLLWNLLSEDDPLEGASGGVAPRDNVVFEAGYLMSAKGPERCLIVRRGEAKMPADVGGNIYVHLKKSSDVSSIAPRLKDFVVRKQVGNDAITPVVISREHRSAQSERSENDRKISPVTESCNPRSRKLERHDTSPSLCAIAREKA